MSSIDPFSTNTPVNPVQPPDLKLDETKVSPFQKFLGPSASKEQVTRFMNQWIQDIIRDMKKSDAKWKETMDKMRRGEY